MPYISVIIPTYNRSSYLPRAITSVLNQSCTDFELFIIDDGSTDGSASLPALKDKRVSYHHLPYNCGVSYARNFGVRLSTAPFIAFLDSDDEWLPHKLRLQMQWLKLNSSYRIMQSSEIWIRNGVRVNPPATHKKQGGDIFLSSLERCMITPSSVILERSLFNECGPFNETLPACEDYDLWLRIAARYPVGLLDEGLLRRFGGHPDQLSATMFSLDRFRIRSLLDLLHREILTSEQTAQAKAMLIKRATILARGFLKHNKPKEAETYAAIAHLFQ